jgi:hypothetical protein
MSKTLFYRWFGLGKVPPRYRPDLEAEGILFEEEGIRVSTTLRRFRSPWRYSSYKRSRCSGAIVLTKGRLIGFGRSKTALHLPLDHESFEFLRVSVEPGSVLCVVYDAARFLPEATGEVEVRFTMEDAAGFLNRLQVARATR